MRAVAWSPVEADTEEASKTNLTATFGGGLPAFLYGFKRADLASQGSYAREQAPHLVLCRNREVTSQGLRPYLALLG